MHFDIILSMFLKEARVPSAPYGYISVTCIGV